MTTTYLFMIITIQTIALCIIAGGVWNLYELARPPKIKKVITAEELHERKEI